MRFPWSSQDENEDSLAELLRDFRREDRTYEKFQIGMKLAECDFPSYGREVLKVARESMAGDDWNNYHTAVAEWMVQKFGTEVVQDIVTYINRTEGLQGYAKLYIIANSVRDLGKDAIPIVLAGLSAINQTIHYTALTGLIALDDGTHFQVISSELEVGLRSIYSATAISYINLATKWNLKAIENLLWSLIESKSKPVREAAARALGSLGDAAVPKAREVLSSKRADVRMAAVQILLTAETPSANDVLEQVVDCDPDDDVREAAIDGLQTVWKASGRALTRQDVEARVSASKSKIKWPPAPWVGTVSLPQLSYIDGQPVSDDVLHYIISRQAKCGEIRPVTGLLPLYEMIDRNTSGDFAVVILNSFIDSRANAKDKWALTLAGVWGDSRIVPIISAKIKEWVETGRGKLAEYAVQSLALIGTNDALLAVDSIAMRYQNKMKNVGAAATEAFNDAAVSMGMTPQELGDRVVPWLGFEQGKPRIIDCGGRSIELSIGNDGKLKYFDYIRDKYISTLPSSTPPEMRLKIKELSAALREVMKAQTKRLELLMVQQHKWSAARWRELFLTHPVLIPFAKKLVWGIYDDSKRLLNTFMTLEDLTLTDNTDNAVELTDQAVVRIIHPLEMPHNQWQKWSAHQSEHRIKPPFAQLDRPVITASVDQAITKICKDLNGISMNGMTFKGRAERLGWRRGSVCDGGAITAYVKSFPALAVDAFVLLNGLFIGIDMYSEVELGDVFFVQSGSVKIGSYIYDEPQDSTDERLIPFGNVPPIVFSEVMGDLRKITIKKQDLEMDLG